MMVYMPDPFLSHAPIRGEMGERRFKALAQINAICIPCRYRSATRAFRIKEVHLPFT